MRLIFLGTPEFAVPTLEAIVATGHEVIAVFTQPDRPKGRSRELTASPVKQAGQRLGLAVYQPERVRRPEVIELLAGMKTDAMVIVGYGQIIPQTIIDLAPHGIINVHASLLPKYRGAAPIQWAIANGERSSGVTTMKIDAGLDTGDILLAQQTDIGPDETAPEVSSRLAAMGATLLVETLRGLEAGRIVAVKQDDSLATYAPILKKEDGFIDWTLPATEIYNRFRGFNPWPGCYTMLRGQLLQVWSARPAEARPEGRPGAIVTARRRLLVACGQSSVLELLEVQLQGRKRVTAEAFLNGYHPGENEVFGEGEH